MRPFEVLFKTVTKCPVCLTDKSGAEMVFSDACVHTICMECSANLRTRQCPMCRVMRSFLFKITQIPNTTLYNMAPMVIAGYPSARAHLVDDDEEELNVGEIFDDAFGYDDDFLDDISMADGFDPDTAEGGFNVGQNRRPARAARNEDQESDDDSEFELENIVADPRDQYNLRRRN